MLWPIVYLAKKDKKIKISFVDSFSAQEVTGSNVYVETPEKLRRNTQRAFERAKREGKNQITFYSQEIREQYIKKLRFTEVLKHSVKENEAFWDEIYGYLNNHYDLSRIKKIYLNADGGSWITAGAERINGVTYVLDEFHLQKYITRLTSHMLDSTDDARKEICDAIRNDDREEFKAVTERLKDALKNPETGEKRINESRDYILNNWMSARVRLKHDEGVIGSSTEGHVYHVLSRRMSTQAMGWSVVGASKMCQLRAYYLNGGDMLELVRYQEKELPAAAGAEKDILTASAIIKSEKNRNEKIGKYVDAITHSVMPEIEKGQWYKGLMGQLSW